jgi:ferredoxin
MIPRPSTREFLQEAAKSDAMTLVDLLHGYIYGRWPYFYIGVAVGEHRLNRALEPLIRWLMNRLPVGGATVGGGADPEASARKAFADGYHGKVMPLAQASRLVTVNRSIELRDLEPVIPYARARDIILRSPDHIVVLDCPCRSARSNPCLPLDVCLIVGEPFAGFMLEHHPGRSRRISPGEAVEILRAEHRRGHVHHAFFKDAMLGRFYAICNCCSCCCGAMQAQRHGIPMLASSGYVAEVDVEACVGCGLCTGSCPFEALVLVGGKSGVVGAACMGCGVCVARCPKGAVKLRREPARGEPLDIRELLSLHAPES